VLKNVIVITKKIEITSTYNLSFSNIKGDIFISPFFCLTPTKQMYQIFPFH